MIRFAAMIGACLTGLAVTSAFAQVASLAAPTGEVILTVSGEIGVTNGEGTASFDLEMLQALPVTRFSTSTTWTEGQHEFTGVSMHDLVETLGVTGTQMEAKAVNDYSVEIPMSDMVEDGPILAYLMDGQPMSLRDKGPIWLIYPFDAKEEYQTEVIYSRSIWQLAHLLAKD